MSRPGQVSRFKVVEADVDQLREHYANTLKPVRVSPVNRGASISVEDLHFSTGDFDIWSGICRSGMEVSFSEPPDAFAIYLPLAGAMELDAGGASSYQHRARLSQRTCRRPGCCGYIPSEATSALPSAAKR